MLAEFQVTPGFAWHGATLWHRVLYSTAPIPESDLTRTFKQYVESESR